MESIEVRYNKLLAESQKKDSQLKAYEGAIESFKNALRHHQVCVAYYEREFKMREAGLSLESKQRLHSAFRNSTDNAGLKEAVNTERKNHDRRGKVQPTACG